MPPKESPRASPANSGTGAPPAPRSEPHRVHQLTTTRPYHRVKSYGETCMWHRFALRFLYYFQQYQLIIVGTEGPRTFILLLRVRYSGH